jgi:hypothetical protein
VEAILVVMVRVVEMEMQQLNACLDKQQHHSKQNENTRVSDARTHGSGFLVRPSDVVCPERQESQKKTCNYPGGSVAGFLVPGCRSVKYPDQHMTILIILQRNKYRT